VIVRDAHRNDLAAIAAIYNAGIAEREATFETTPRRPDEIAGWLDADLPFLVADDGGSIAGFARLSPYSDRCVYNGVAEYGVYVDPRARGRGIGRLLLDALCAEAERQGIYKITSRIFTTNAASRALARRCGFREVGIQLRHGRLDGDWRDCVLVERLLGDAAADAQPDSQPASSSSASGRT
jgi:L-amino acid N-acyltransferase YncA